MARAVNIMKGGWSAGNAKAVNGAIATGLTATGTTLGTALAITADTAVFGTVGSGTGASLPATEIGDSVEIYNGGANALTVYPDASNVQINALTAGNGFSLGVNTMCYARRITATRWIVNPSA